MEKAKKWSATTRPSLVHKQSIRVVSATAIWPTSDLGPRIDRPPFVIPLRDILSFLVECRVILCGKRRREPGTSSTAILVDSPVCPWACKICLKRTIYIIVLQRNTRDWFREFQREPSKFLLPSILLNTPCPLPYLEIEHCILQFQIKKMLKLTVLGRDRYLCANIFFQTFYYLSDVAKQFRYRTIWLGLRTYICILYTFFLASLKRSFFFFFAMEFEIIFFFWFVKITMTHE